MTPDPLIKKGAYLDDADQPQQKTFTREDCLQMINATYNEFYGKFRDQFNPQEYMDVVDDEKFIERFGQYLDQTDMNVLNQKTMPYFDLGAIPVTHSFMRRESD